MTRLLRLSRNGSSQQTGNIDANDNRDESLQCYRRASSHYISFLQKLLIRTRNLPQIYLYTVYSSQLILVTRSSPPTLPAGDPSIQQIGREIYIIERSFRFSFLTQPKVLYFISIGRPSLSSTNAISSNTSAGVCIVYSRLVVVQYTVYLSTPLLSSPSKSFGLE